MIPFEFFIVLVGATALFLWHGFKAPNYATLTMGSFILFFLGRIAGAEGIASLDGTIYTYANSVMVSVFAQGAIIASVVLFAVAAWAALHQEY